MTLWEEELDAAKDLYTILDGSYSPEFEQNIIVCIIGLLREGWTKDQIRDRWNFLSDMLEKDLTVD